jgi:hypothetical protein
MLSASRHVDAPPARDDSPSTATATATASETGTFPWHAWLVVFRPDLVSAGLEQIRRAGIVPKVPTLWQIQLGVLSMWHRVLFRSETIGTCAEGRVRSTLRARILHRRALRAPFLLRERAIAPWDFSGLVSSPERLIRHLLGAHHDNEDYLYDISILACYPGRLEEALQRTKAVTTEATTHARWLKDLVVFEGYHERLERSLERVIEEGVQLPYPESADPDVSFLAYLNWCAAQPSTPSESWSALRKGKLKLARQTGELVS